MLIFFLVSIVMTWMVVNGGMFLVQAPFYPSDYLVITIGSRAVGGPSLAFLAIPQHALMRSWGELRALLPMVIAFPGMAGEAGYPEARRAEVV